MQPNKLVADLFCLYLSSHHSNPNDSVSPKVSGTKNGGTVPYKATLAGGLSFTYRITYSLHGCFQNNGTPKSSILIGVSIINHPFWGTPIFGNTHM